MLAFARLFCTILLVVLIGPAAMAGEVVVPFISGEATVTKGANGMTSLSVPNMTPDTSPGNPALPFAYKHVLLPPDADLKSLRIEIRNGVERKVSGSFTVRPAGPARTTDDERKEFWGQGKAIFNGFNLDVYAEKKFYPADYATAEPSGQLGPYVMVPVKFWPYRYNPASGELRHLVKGDVAVVFDSKPGVTAASLPPTQPAYDEIVQGLTINGSQASTMYAGVSSVLSASTSILVLTTDAIVNGSSNLSSWVAHKEAQGWTVDVVTNTTAWGGGGGYMEGMVTACRSYLQSVYSNYRYVVFIGDPDPYYGEMGTFPVWGLGYPNAEYGWTPSDGPYSDMSGTWDLDGDTAYGEPADDFGAGGADFNYELIVGRIPNYGNMTDLDHILQKLIDYEDAATVSGKMQRVICDMKPSDEYTPGYYLGEAIRTDVCNAARGREHYRMYDSTYSLMPPPDYTPCTSMPLIDTMNAGAGLLVWWAHGNITFADCILDVDNCIPYINDVSMVPMTFQASCDNAYPDVDYNLAYRLLLRGCINTIAAARVSWYYPGETVYTNSDSNAGMAYRYAYNVARNKNRSGDSLANTVLVTPVNTPWNHMTFLMYGDPTMSLTWPTSFAMESPATLASAKRNSAYRTDLFASGGTLPYTWSRTSGTLPRGISLNSTGYLSGTPTRTGTYTFTLRCTHAGGAYVSRTFTLTVTN